MENGPMKRYLPFLIIISLVFYSCAHKGAGAGSDKERISFLGEYGLKVDVERPYYSSSCRIPVIFDTVWNMRLIFARDLLGIKLSRYKGRDCEVYMYPLKLSEGDGKAAPETRAVVVSSGGDIICSYIEFISELSVKPPMSLKGRSIEEISDKRWEDWKTSIDTDSDKRLVVLQYYDMLRCGNYSDAYCLLYDRKSISREDFIKAASGDNLPVIDFAGM
jgi:hypothetical protein